MTEESRDVHRMETKIELSGPYAFDRFIPLGLPVQSGTESGRWPIPVQQWRIAPDMVIDLPPTLYTVAEQMTRPRSGFEIQGDIGRLLDPDDLAAMHQHHLALRIPDFGDDTGLLGARFLFTLDFQAEGSIADNGTFVRVEHPSTGRSALVLFEALDVIMAADASAAALTGEEAELGIGEAARRWWTMHGEVYTAGAALRGQAWSYSTMVAYVWNGLFRLAAAGFGWLAVPPHPVALGRLSTTTSPAA